MCDRCECSHFDDRGACDVFEKGRNGRCVYCDHAEGCHPGTGRYYNTPFGYGDRDKSCASYVAKLESVAEPSYTIAQIKAAYWAEFHKAGEVWFDYLNSEMESQEATNCRWSTFLENLVGEEKVREVEL